MPEKKTIERAKKDRREGKSASTQAGEFVLEEFEHIREGKHGARSPEQAIAIGLSEARRAGVDLPPPKKGKASEKTITQAERDRKAAKKGTSRKPSSTRSRATKKALKREGHAAASTQAVARHARKAARQRSPGERSAAARKAARTKGASKRSAAAKKAARTRANRNR